jgi:hypothetical protein
MLVMSFKILKKSTWQEPLFYFFCCHLFWAAFWRNFGGKKKHWVQDER